MGAPVLTHRALPMTRSGQESRPKSASPDDGPAGPDTEPGSTLRYGDVDGHGYCGILTETDDGLRCYECAWIGAHLGLHVAKAHDIPARHHRVKHGYAVPKGSWPRRRATNCKRAQACGTPTTARSRAFVTWPKPTRPG